MKRFYWLLAIAAATAACGDDSPSTGGGGQNAGGQGGSGTGASGLGGAGAGGAGMGGSGGEGGMVPVADVHLVGRYETTNDPRATWPASSAIAHMNGPDASVRLSGSADLWFEIVIDGTSTGRFKTSGGEQVYPLATGLSAGEHTIEIVRRNEGFFGEFTFLGFEPQTAVVPSPYPYEHRVEFVGDSLTCGYGIEGAPGCSFSGDTESAYSTYALVAGRTLDFASHLICYSGKGVHQNYGGDLSEPMPVLYPRTLTDSPAPTWDPSAFPADAVVVNLGTNDFSAALDENAFVADYVALLTTIRSRHPSAYILGITWANWGASNESLVTDAFGAFDDANTGTLQFTIDPSDGFGCDYHTNVVTNQKLGALLSTTLHDRLGW
ncbi:MAG: GDSL-type esterase/lipase family protein [Polyangiaceae bacterium]